MGNKEGEVEKSMDFVNNSILLGTSLADPNSTAAMIDATITGISLLGDLNNLINLGNENSEEKKSAQKEVRQQNKKIEWTNEELNQKEIENIKNFIEKINCI